MYSVSGLLESDKRDEEGVMQFGIFTFNGMYVHSPIAKHTRIAPMNVPCPMIVVCVCMCVFACSYIGTHVIVHVYSLSYLDGCGWTAVRIFIGIFHWKSKRLRESQKDRWECSSSLERNFRETANRRACRLIGWPDWQIEFGRDENCPMR